MSEKYPLGNKFLELALDVFYRWAGELLGKTVPVSTASPIVARQNMVSLTVLLDPGMADELAQLAQVMQTNESDVLVRLIKIAHMIREFGLYGVPTPDGNYLGIHVRKTQEVHKVNLECPAQKQHPPVDPTGEGKPPSRFN
jgi:hypothetical protein